MRAQEHTKLLFFSTSCANCDADAVGRILALHQAGQADMANMCGIAVMWNAVDGV